MEPNAGKTGKFTEFLLHINKIHLLKIEDEGP